MPTDPPTPPSSPDGAATVRILARTNGETRRLEGTDQLPAILADPEARVWVDVTSSSPSDILPVAKLLDLHPLIADDIAERNQRAKVAEVEGMIHVVLFWIAYQGEVTEVEVDLVLGSRALLTVHEPGWDPYTLPQLRGDPGNLLKRGPDYLLYAITDGIVDGYFPVIDALDDEIDALQDDVIAEPDDLDAGAAVRAQARAHPPAPRDVPVARDLQPAHEPRPGARQARARRLLPRRVRPPDPGHRRAGQRPRAGRRARSRSTCRRSTTTCRRS